MRQCWNIISGKNYIWLDWVGGREKYIRDANFWDHVCPSHASWGWRCILKVWPGYPLQKAQTRNFLKQQNIPYDDGCIFRGKAR